MTTACTGDKEEDDLCTDLCIGYLDCLDLQDGSSALPLFCENLQPGRQDDCVTECNTSLEALGESRQMFTECAQCVIPYIGEQICDQDLTYQTGVVSCPSQCDDAKVEAAASLFYDRFDIAVNVTPTSENTCTDVGTIKFAPTDSRFSHREGNEGENGSWTCNGIICSCNDMIYGPYVTLPPGDYQVLFRMNGTLGENSSIGFFNVHTNENPNIEAWVDIDAEAFAKGSVSISFKLSVETRDLEFRTRFCPDVFDNTTLTVTAIELARN